MNKINYTIIGISLLGLMGCGSPKPLFSNSHHNTFTYKKSTDDFVQVRIGLSPLESPKKEEVVARQAWDLRDSLPHLLVKTLATKAKTAEEIMTLMSKPIPPAKEEKKQEASPGINYTEVKVRLSFANVKRYLVDGKYAHDNTRLDYLNTYLKIADADKNNISFLSIDKMENELEEIDLGSITRDKSVTFNTKLTATGDLGSSVESTNVSSSENNTSNGGSKEKKVYDEDGNEIGVMNKSGQITGKKSNSNTTTGKSGASANVTGEIGYLDTEAIKEAAMIKLRRMRTGFAFSQQELVISQAGRPNGDISNNVFINATLQFKASVNTDEKSVYKFNNLFDEKYQLAAADKLLFSNRTIKYIKCTGAKAIVLTSEFEAKLRGVDNVPEQTGENHLEYDDKVTYYVKDLKAGPTVNIDPGLFCKDVYKITAKNKAGHLYNLRISWTTDEELCLFSEDKPAEFLQWVLRQLSSPDKKALSTTRFELYFLYNGDKIYVTKAKMEDSDITKLKTLNDISLVKRTD